MTELQYRQWENDSQHDSYNTANERRLTLFSEKIEGLQVKVKRTSEGKFVVKTRVPLPPKPAPKKKAPARTRKKAATTTKTTARKPAPKAAPKEEPKPAAPKPEAKKRTRKTSRKRK